MSDFTGKVFVDKADGTPQKRFFHSIINDYVLKTGVCELIDNALDHWLANGKQNKLKIKVNLDTNRQMVYIEDNAGGVKEEHIQYLIAPGASGNEFHTTQIGMFGVGGKRAGIALGE